MRGKYACVALAVAAVSPIVAAQDVDVEIQIIPRQVFSGGMDERLESPLPDAAVAAGSSHVWEFWASDVGSINTGIVAAYVNVFYDTGWVDAGPLNWSPLFPLFREGLIDDGAGLVENFGAGGMDPYGVEPNWVRLGWVDVVAGAPPTPQLVDLEAEVGIGEIGVFGRMAGPVSITAHDYWVPEPSAAALIAMGGLLACRRRFGGGRGLPV